MISEMKREPATIPFWHTLKDDVGVQPTTNGLIFWWSRKDVGFGSVTLSFDKDGQLLVDNECMSPEFCGEIITQAITEAMARQKSEEGRS